MLEKYIKKLLEKKEIYLKIKVNPGSQKNEVKNILEDETIKINISSQAEKGKANQELIKFLAKNFLVSCKEVKIISGAKERIKLLKIVKK